MARRATTRCARCGRPVDPSEHLCAECREEAAVPVPTTDLAPPPSEYEERSRRWPASMERPSPMQFHATVMVTIFVVLLALALWALLNNRGVGPFEASVRQVAPSGGGRTTVTVDVRNDGSKSARATCHVTVRDSSGGRLDETTVLTPPIAPGDASTVEAIFVDLRTTADEFEVSCR